LTSLERESKGAVFGMGSKMRSEWQLEQVPRDTRLIMGPDSLRLGPLTQNQKVSLTQSAKKFVHLL